MKHLLQKNKRRLLLAFVLAIFAAITTSIQAQILTETFEEADFSTANLAGGGVINNTNNNVTSVVTYYTAILTSTNTSTSYNAPITGSWFYSGLSTNSAPANSYLKTVRSVTNSIKFVSNPSFLITPIITDGITSATTFYYAQNGNGIAVGLLTGTNTISTVTNSAIRNNVAFSQYFNAPTSYVTGTAGATIASSNMAAVPYSYTGSFSGPCQVIFYVPGSGGGTGAFIDDISITPIVTGSPSPTLSAAAGQSVDNDFTITFTDDATWRGLVTGITVDGTSYLAASGAYTLSAGSLVLARTSIPKLNTAGSHTIVVLSTGYSNASVSQTNVAGAATKLAMKTQPVAATGNGAVLATQPEVYIQDQYGNATTSGATVTATVGSGSWTIGGSDASGKAAVGGTVTFTNLTATYSSPVAAATISFASTGLTPVTSSSFSVPAPAVTDVDNAIGYTTAYAMVTAGGTQTLSSGATEFTYTAATAITSQVGYTILNGVTYNCGKIGSNAGSDLNVKYFEGSLTANSSTSKIKALKIGTTSGSSATNFAVVYSSVCPFSSSSVISVEQLASTPNTLGSLTLVTANVPATAKSYRIYRLVTISGTNYGAGNSQYVFHIVTTVGPTIVPLTAPTVGTASDRATDGFTANWTDGSNESSYTVNVYKASDNSLITSVSAEQDASSVAVTGLAINTAYYYKVVAVGDGTTYSNSTESTASANVSTITNVKDITAFTIAGVEATIDGTDITAEIPSSTSYIQTPEITVSQYASYDPTGAVDFSTPQVFTVTAEDGSEKEYTVIISKAAVSTACDMTDISITGQISSQIDGLNVTVVMPYGTTVTALTPTVETSLAATYDPEGEQNFTSPVVYTVVAEDEATYQEYTVTVQIAEPTITVAETQIDLSTTGWVPSSSTSRAVSGSNLVSNISVSVTGPFQISNDDATWGTSTSFTKSGFTAGGTLYVRYNQTSGDGTDNGTVTISATGATEKSFTVTGTAAAVISNPSNKNQAVKKDVAIVDIEFTVTGGVTEATCTGLPAGVTFDDETYTISGTPTTSTYQAYPYTVTIKGPVGTTDATQTGTITVKDPNAKRVAVLYTGTTLPSGTNKESAALVSYDVTVYNVSTNNTAAYMDGIIAENYDLIILHEAVPSANLAALRLGYYIGTVPILNNKSHMYSKANWPAGGGNNGAAVNTSVTVDPLYKNHPIFKDVTFSGNSVTMAGSTGIIRWATVTNTTNQRIIALNSAGTAGAISILEDNTSLTTKKKYMLIALAAANEDYTADGIKVIKNACDYLMSTQEIANNYTTTTDGDWTSDTKWNEGLAPVGPSTVTISKKITVPATSSVTAANIIVEPTATLTVVKDGTDNGTLTIPSGGKLILKSDATGTAQLKNDGTVSNGGTVVIRKSFTAAGGWYFISFPFNVPAANVLVTSTQTQAAWGDLTDDNSKDFYVAEYDANNRAAGNFNATSSPNWISVSGKTFVANKGYIVGVANDIVLDFVSSAGVTDLFGTSAQINVAKYPAAISSNQDWNLIGVPFSSAYELADASAEHAPYYCYNGSTYQSVMPEDSYEAYPFTAFFLQAYGASEAVTFSSEGRLVKAAAVKDFSEIGLVVKNAKYSDKTRIRLQDGASLGYELGKDAVKFFSSKAGVPQIACKQAGLDLSVNSVPANTRQVEVTVNITEDGMYTISLDGAGEGCQQVILVDGETETDLLADDYSFAGTAGSTKSMSVLLVSEGTTAVGTAGSGSILIQTIGEKAYISGLEGAATVNVYDVAGKLAQRFTGVNNGDALTLNNAGVALIEVKTAAQIAKAKVSVK